MPEAPSRIEDPVQDRFNRQLQDELFQLDKELRLVIDSIFRADTLDELKTLIAEGLNNG